MKWPTGYFCEKCGCTEYYYRTGKKCYRCKHCHHDERLLAKTAFDNNELPLNTLLYGLFLIFYSKRGIASTELAEELKINYKSVCLLQEKCRMLMKDSNLNRLIEGNYLGMDKRILPLYLSHRNTKNYLEMIKRYIQKSIRITKKMITSTLNIYALTRGLIEA